MRSRTSKTLFVLWAVLAVFVARGVARQRRHAAVCPHVRLAQRRPRGVGLHRAVLLFALSRAAAVWDGPISWIEGGLGSIGNFFGSVADDVKDFVLAAIRAALDGLTDIFDSIDDLVRIALDGIDQLARYVVSVIADLRNLITDVGTWVLAVARNLIDDAVSMLTAALDAVRSFAQDAATWVWNAVQTLITDAISTLDTVLRAVIQTAVDAVTAAITLLVDTVRDELRALIDALNDEVFGRISYVVGVVEDVLDWLVAIATFPFSTARDLWNAFRQATGRDVLDNAQGFHERNGAAAIDHARRYVS